VFVTSAYKKKLEDLRLEEEKEQREEYLEKIGDVTKQRDLGNELVIHEVPCKVIMIFFLYFVMNFTNRMLSWLQTSMNTKPFASLFNRA
jgi:hypothetical protein